MITATLAALLALSQQSSTAVAQGPKAAAPQQPQIASPLDRVDDALEAGDLTRAQKLLDEYNAANKPDARAIYDGAYIEQQTGKLNESETDFRRALTLDAKLPQVHIALGHTLLLEHKPDEARKEWQLVSANTVYDARYRAEALRAIARMDAALLDAARKEASGEDSATSKLVAEARDALLQAISLTEATSADRILTARLAETAGDPADAENELRKLIAADPGNLRAQLSLADLLRLQKRLPEAETVLRTAHASAPDSLDASRMLGAVLAAEEKTPEALQLLKNAHDTHPEDPATTKLLADVANQHDSDPALAAGLLEAMLRKHPDDPALLADYGAALVRQGEFDQAIAVLQHATVLKPTDGDAWASLAFAASRAGQFPLVLTALTQRKKYLSDNASSYFLWGQAYDRLHHNKEAAEYYRQFLKAAGGRFPDQEFQVRHRLTAMGESK